MKIKFVEIQNFRKLKSCRIDFSDKETLFVGANNSGKTSAMDALILFLKDKTKFRCRDFTLSNWSGINKIGQEWTMEDLKDIPDRNIQSWENYLPCLDVWIEVEENEIHYVSHIIPTLNWTNGLLGVRFRLEPKNLINIFEEYRDAFLKAEKARTKLAEKEKTKSAEKEKTESAEEVKTKSAEKGQESTLKIWPCDMWGFLEKRRLSDFSVSSYILNPELLKAPEKNIAKLQRLSEDSLPLEKDPFEGLIKIDIIYAQRGFTDPNAEHINSQSGLGNLSTQLKEYYRKHLDPNDEPNDADIDALQAIDTAQTSFDEKLAIRFKNPLSELEELNYPGFGNPNITLSSRIDPLDSLNHSSSVLFDLQSEGSKDEDDLLLHLPEKYNGLGYQNLISMVFKLIRFRDEWMKAGKISDKSKYAPLHLVLLEEPEAHLHAQVQQVFIKKAYEVLNNNKTLKSSNIFTTQLVVSTHSNHIAHEVDFIKIRYFKRNFPCPKGEVPTSSVINLSTVFGGEDETTKFAIRYLKTTHCDLFFSDATILIEGSAERILVPHFILNSYPELSSSYISFLEIGGRHAHRLKPLIEKLGLVTLIISDIDACNPSTKRSKVQPLKGKKYETGNTTLVKWLPCKKGIDDLLKLRSESKISTCGQIRVAYQYPIMVTIADKKSVNPSTFEDALVLDNIPFFQSLTEDGLFKKINNALGKSTVEAISKEMFEVISKEKNKAGFALDLFLYEEPNELKAPQYIAEGLSWLEKKLNNTKVILKA